jgi:hypothetical protein
VKSFTCQQARLGTQGRERIVVSIHPFFHTEIIAETHSLCRFRTQGFRAGTNWQLKDRDRPISLFHISHHFAECLEL